MFNDERHEGAYTRVSVLAPECEEGRKMLFSVVSVSSFSLLQILTINQLQESDSGEYRCAISNRAGPGKSLSGFILRPWGVFCVSFYLLFVHQIVQIYCKERI